MENPTFYIVDVFAEEKYAGNQLAVVREAGHLPDDTMQRIAAEMNFSETTFILSEEERDGGYDVRIFTPEYEVPLRRTSHARDGVRDPERGPCRTRRRVVLNLKVERIPVTFGEVLWMEQLPPSFGEVLDPARLPRVLNLEEKDLDERYPAQEVSTGLPAIIVPLAGFDALRRCRVDRERYFRTYRGHGGQERLRLLPRAARGGQRPRRTHVRRSI
jgi:trans-2,3-dihydro-3-hydroxyanthranilate isomerase